MVERSGTSGATRGPQPIAIRHLLATRRPWLRNELTGSLENLAGGGGGGGPATSSRRGSVSLEKEMDSSVENLFRDLEEPLGRRRDRSSLDENQRSRAGTLDGNLGSRSGTIDGDQRTRSGTLDGNLGSRSGTIEGNLRSRSGTLDGNQRSRWGTLDGNLRSRSGNSFGGVGSSSRFNGSTSLNDDFLRLDSSDDCFEEASGGFHAPRSKPSLYVDCSETGNRKFRMDFDAESFDRDDISVTVHPGSRLEVHAIRENANGGRRTTQEFSRRIRLPVDVDVRGLNCTLVDGRIVLEAPLLLLTPQKPVSTPRLHPGNPDGRNSVGSKSPGPSELLNVPVVKVVNGVNVLSLCVEVGRVFRSDDVTVKVRDPAKVVVSADRSEVTDCSRMTASLVREFDLPARISTKTLKAGLTEQGLLRITAHLLSDEVG